MVEFNISGGVVLAGARILFPIDVATVEPGINLPVSGTLGVGTIVAPVSVGTVLAPVPVTGTVTTAGAGGLFILFYAFALVTILANAVVFSSIAATLSAASLQDLVVDLKYGTVVTGSINTTVQGVEPQTGLQTSTIVAGGWFAGTVVTTQRLVAGGPLGALVAVVPQNALGGTIGAGSLQGVYITAQLSTGR